MTTIIGDIFNIAGVRRDGEVEIRSLSVRAKASGAGTGMVIPDIQRFPIADGALLMTNVEPGPAKIIARAGLVWRAQWEVNVPDSATPVQLLDLIQQFEPVDPPLVSKAWQAAQEAAGYAEEAKAVGSAQDAAIAALIAGNTSTKETLAAEFAPKPSGTLTEYGLSIADSSAPNGVRWSTAQEPVARALGWAIATDPQWAGGAKPDGTNSAPAIQAALNGAASCVYLPEGAFTIDAAINVTGFHGKRLVGAGRTLTRLVVSNAVPAPAAILGTSLGITDLTLRDFTVDMGWAPGDPVLHCIQITNGARIVVESVGIKNSGGAGILLQGVNASGGTPDSTVRGCVIESTGLADGTTGHGIWLKDKSDRGLVEQNRLTGIKGGMGIGLSGSAGTGFPTMCRILNNHVQMVSSGTGFEAVGITAGCNNAVVSGNVVRDTFDNGISVTADDCTVVGNNVDGTWNHGITAGGRGTQVVGNFVRNVGKENPALGFGGITLDTGASWCVITGNTIEDNQGTHTMAYGVKINTSGGNNRIGLNSIAGWLTSAYSGVTSTDIVMDAESKTDGYSFSKIYTDTLNVKTTNSTLNVPAAVNLSNFTIIGAGAAKNAQCTVYSNAGSTRANLALSRATGQVADLLQALNESGTVTARISALGRVEGLDGVVTRSVGDISGKTSTQIDALFSAAPPDGTIASGLNGSTPVVLHRVGGKWNRADMVQIA